MTQGGARSLFVMNFFVTKLRPSEIKKLFPDGKEAVS